MTSKPPALTLATLLSFVAGLGLTLMVIGAALGVTGGGGSDLGLLFAAGAILFICGVIAWFASARPDAGFDDIDEPRYHGHDDH
ncbi:MAG: hypothetical protein OXB89_00890 [Anaerolineaceae bacterium]|nr:hypothetical protein [Anaerolineaceae bacterium]